MLNTIRLNAEKLSKIPIFKMIGFLRSQLKLEMLSEIKILIKNCDNEIG